MTWQRRDICIMFTFSRISAKTVIFTASTKKHFLSQATCLSIWREQNHPPILLHCQPGHPAQHTVHSTEHSTEHCTQHRTQHSTQHRTQHKTQHTAQNTAHSMGRRQRIMTLINHTKDKWTDYEVPLKKKEKKQPPWKWTDDKIDKGLVWRSQGRRGEEMRWAKWAGGRREEPSNRNNSSPNTASTSNAGGKISSSN